MRLEKQGVVVEGSGANSRVSPRGKNAQSGREETRSDDIGVPAQAASAVALKKSPAKMPLSCLRPSLILHPL